MADHESEVINRGKFIVVEGLDDVGKTIAIEKMIEMELLKGSTITTGLNQKTGTELFKKIYDLIQRNEKFSKETKRLLYETCLYDLCDQIKNTLIEKKTNVICDRYIYSFLFYNDVSFNNIIDDRLMNRIIFPDKVLFFAKGYVGDSIEDSFYKISKKYMHDENHKLIFCYPDEDALSRLKDFLNIPNEPPTLRHMSDVFQYEYPQPDSHPRKSSWCRRLRKSLTNCLYQACNKN